jgi:ABC-type molybdate transport system ATPase subunit
VDRGAYVPERSILLAKNAYRVPVLRTKGALCTVLLGGANVRVFSFSDTESLAIRIPPEAVTVHRACPGPSTAENVFPMRVKKLRRLGQVTNCVLAGDGFELNTLHADCAVERLALAEGDKVFASVQATAIRTEASQQEEG